MEKEETRTEYLLPVSIEKIYDSTVASYEESYEEGGLIHSFAVNEEDLKSPEDLRMEGAEQMRQAWFRIKDMTQEERYRLFSFNDAGCLLINESAENILAKLKEYDSVAREGQIWESKDSNPAKLRLVIINPGINGDIHYLAWGHELFTANHSPKSEFYELYQNTERTIDLEKDNVFKELRGDSEVKIKEVKG